MSRLGQQRDFNTVKFRQWLQKECDRLGSVRQFAREANVNHATIATLLKSNRVPDPSTVMKLSAMTDTHPYKIWSLLDPRWK